MFTVADIKADVVRVLGGADDATFYARLNHAVEILSTEAEWDPLLGYVDVCVSCDCFVTLPREVGTVLAVNIGGQPSMAHDFLYKWHLNGPGNDCQETATYHWFDGLMVPTFRDPPPTAIKLGTVLETNLDDAKAFRVYGYDVSGTWIRSTEGGLQVDGFLVPMNFGTSVPNATAPKIRRITRVTKPVTSGFVDLMTVADDATLTRIGHYMPDEVEPMYRRIQLSKSCTWARIAFRKGEVNLSKLTDLIPLHSKYAVVLMAKSLKKMDEDLLDEAVKYQQMAVSLLLKKQLSVSVPSGPSIQVAKGNLLADRTDRLE